MPVEMLNYQELGARLGASAEAARAVTKRLRLPRQRGNDGKTLVAVDLAEIRHKPMPARSPAGHRPDTDGYATHLEAKITELEDHIAQLEIAASGHRADFDRERERGDSLMTEILKFMAAAMSAREAAARLEGEVAALRSRPWWQRLVG
jgi:nucleotide-binding universal stress UspA family protein